MTGTLVDAGSIFRIWRLHVCIFRASNFHGCLSRQNGAFPRSAVHRVLLLPTAQPPLHAWQSHSVNADEALNALQVLGSKATMCACLALGLQVPFSIHLPVRSVLCASCGAERLQISCLPGSLAPVDGCTSSYCCEQDHGTRV